MGGLERLALAVTAAARYAWPKKESVVGWSFVRTSGATRKAHDIANSHQLVVGSALVWVCWTTVRVFPSVKRGPGTINFALAGRRGPMVEAGVKDCKTSPRPHERAL